MAWGKTEGTQSGRSGPLAGFLVEKGINKHRKGADLQLHVLIGDEVVAADFRIPAWMPLFPLHTSNPFIS